MLSRGAAHTDEAAANCRHGRVRLAITWTQRIIDSRRRHIHDALLSSQLRHFGAFLSTLQTAHVGVPEIK